MLYFGTGNIDPGDVLPYSPFWIHQALKGFTPCEKMEKLAVTLFPLVQDMIKDKVPQVMGAILQRPYSQLVNLCCNKSKLRSVVFFVYLSLTSSRSITEHDVRKGQVASSEQGVRICEPTGRPLPDARGTRGPPTSTATEGERTCDHCQHIFESRNKLFEHIQTVHEHDQAHHQHFGGYYDDFPPEGCIAAAKSFPEMPTVELHNLDEYNPMTTSTTATAPDRKGGAHGPPRLSA